MVRRSRSSGRSKSRRESAPRTSNRRLFELTLTGCACGVIVFQLCQYSATTKGFSVSFHAYLDILTNVTQQATNAATSGVASLMNDSTAATMTTSTTEAPIASVAYLMSITGCSRRFAPSLHDPAMVLRKSIQLQSYPLGGRYAADFFVIFPPHLETSACARAVEQAGWKVAVFEVPVTPEQIAVSAPELGGDLLKNQIAKDGCCGHWELLKLHAFSMTNYTAAVHLDLDTLVNGPLDELVDVIHYPPHTEHGKKARQHFVQQQLASPNFEPAHPFMETTFHHFYTKDYNMIPRGKHARVGIQGGFFVVRPNITVRDDIVTKIKMGHFVGGADISRSGWFGSGYGKHIWGVMTIQGFLGYYFDRVTKHNSVELHRCKFNQIADNPHLSTFMGGKIPRPTPLPHSNYTKQWQDTKDCRDGRAQCDDVQCQTWPINDTRVFHYTYCKKPWDCPAQQPVPQCLNDDTCQQMHHQWHLVRKQVQGAEQADGEYFKHLTEGFCRKAGEYIRYIASS